MMMRINIMIKWIIIISKIRRRRRRRRSYK